MIITQDEMYRILRSSDPDPEEEEEYAYYVELQQKFPWKAAGGGLAVGICVGFWVGWLLEGVWG